MLATPMEQKLRGMIEPSLDAMGYSVVLVRLRDGARKVLEIMAERKDDRGMSIDDCTDISNTVSALMDVEDPIQGAYQLEVASPGLDRPLTSLGDYTRFSGMEAKVELALPLEGRKRFRGMLKGVEGENILMDMDGKRYALPFNNVRTAKLVLTDELMAQFLKQQKKQ